MRDTDISIVMRALASDQNRPEWQVIAAESESAKALWAQIKRMKIIDSVPWENNRYGYQMAVGCTQNENIFCA